MTSATFTSHEEKREGTSIGADADVANFAGRGRASSADSNAAVSVAVITAITAVTSESPSHSQSCQASVDFVRRVSTWPRADALQ